MNQTLYRPVTKQCSVSILNRNIPTIYFTSKSILKIETYVSECSNEISWIGEVKTDTDNNSFIIEDVHLIEQENSGAYTEMDEIDLAKFTADLIKNDPDGIDKANRLQFWGHSHVNMGVSGSTKDDDTVLRVYQKSGYDFAIRGIFNKRGEISLNLYDYKNQLIYIDVPWNIIFENYEAIIEETKKEIKDKVKERESVHFVYNGVPAYRRVHDTLYDDYYNDRFPSQDFNRNDDYKEDRIKYRGFDVIEKSFGNVVIDHENFKDDIYGTKLKAYNAIDTYIFKKPIEIIKESPTIEDYKGYKISFKDKKFVATNGKTEIYSRENAKLDEIKEQIDIIIKASKL